MIEVAADTETLGEISEDESVTVGGSDYGGVNPESTGDKTRIIEDGDVEFGEDEEWARSG